MDGSTHSSTATCIAGATGATGAAGAPGAAGANGKGVAKVTPQYYLSTSDQNTVGGNWSNTPPVIDKNKYLWTRSHVEYTDGTSYDSTAVLDKSLNDLTNRVTSAEATLTVQAGQIQSKASQSSVDSLGNRIGEAESAITQNAKDITAKVSSGDVESIIEEKADSIRLKTTTLTWEATNSSMDKDGKLTCKGADIAGHMITRSSINGDHLVIDYGNIIGQYGSNDEEYGTIDYVDNVHGHNNIGILHGMSLSGEFVRIHNCSDIMMDATNYISINCTDGISISCSDLAISGAMFINPNESLRIVGGGYQYTGYSGKINGARFINGICVGPA